MMKHRKRGILFLLLILVSAGLWSQTADELEALLTVPQVSYAQAARFVVAAADVAADPDAAFSYALEQEWLPKNTAPGERARLDGISLLIMRAFGLKGGLLYTAAKNAHYAYRELVYQQVIRDRADPAMPVSGAFLLFMLDRVLAAQENTEDL